MAAPWVQGAFTVGCQASPAIRRRAFGRRGAAEWGPEANPGRRLLGHPDPKSPGRLRQRRGNDRHSAEEARRWPPGHPAPPAR